MKILIVDDHKLFIDGFSLLLEKLDEQVKIFKATTAQEAFKLLVEVKGFDLLLLDLSLQGLDGLSLLKKLRSQGSKLPVIVVSGTEDLQRVRAVLDAGALGFIPKSLSGVDIQQAITQVLAGKQYIPEDWQLRLSEDNNNNSAERLLKEFGLSEAQYRIIEVLGKGLSNKQIAYESHISESTVKFHLGNIFKLFNVKNRLDLLIELKRLGLI